MLYHLLYSLHDYVSWFNVFRYQTFRAMLAFLFSFLFVILLEPLFIKWLKNIGVKGQPIRDDGPQGHSQKSGTPTMGGLLIVAAVSISALLFCDLTVKFVWLALFVLLAYAWLGFVDDWRKVSKQNSKGVSGKTKIFWQCSIALIAGLILYYTAFSPELLFPFFKNYSLNLGLLFLIFVMLVMVGTSNAVNLTDGLDGLAIGSVISVASVYALFAYLAGHKALSDYLGLMYVPGAGELSVILAAVVAAGLGFLWYNAYPAQVFMGDIGALSLGGLLGFVAVVAKQELLLLISGGVFVAEALSVIIQTQSYKWRKKRVFKMAPIHHHFELLGWSEPKIIVRFWIISIFLALLSLTTIKLR